MTSRKRLGRLSAIGYLLSAVLVFSGCPKEPPRPKVANPMIDSAEKFREVYTETIPTQTGLDAFMGILGGKKESLAAEDSTQGPAAGESVAGGASSARNQADTAKSEPARSPDTARPKESGDGSRVLLVPDTSEPVYNPGSVEMVCLVHHVGIEGGFWGLTGENGQNYDPLNLPEDLKRAGLRVRFWLRMRKDIATTHMWGAPVQIVAYSIPKK